jgi:hypothetical protein
LFDAFYHSGALVFGGGHVELPRADTMSGIEKQPIEADRPQWAQSGRRGFR